MMCLLESHDMLGFVDGTLENPKQNGDYKMKAAETAVEARYREWKRSDALVQGWIFGSLSEDLMRTVIYLHTANDVLKKLTTTYKKEVRYYVPNIPALAVRDLNYLIVGGKWDDAYWLIKKYPEIVRADSMPLRSIVEKQDAYFSGTRYNSYQRFVYSHVPIEDNSGKFVSKIWKVAVLHVSHIKHLHDDKVKHNKALMVLKSICEEVGRLDDIDEHYLEAITLALELDIPEPIEEIIRSNPNAISISHNDYNVAQLAIINRCEKVYTRNVRRNLQLARRR